MFTRSLFVLTLTSIVACSSCQKTKVESTATNTGTPPFTATVTTIAGDVAQRGAKDDPDPLKARFLYPKKMIWDDRNQSLYISDGSGASSLRKIDGQGKVSTPVAYVGTSNEIHDLCLAPGNAGSIYFATTLGQLEKVEDGGTPQILIDWKRQNGTRKQGNETGSLDVAAISGPEGLTAAPNGDIYFSNSWYKTIHKITMHAIGNEVTAFAGKPTTGVSALPFDFANGPGNVATFGSINDMAIDGNGMIYVADPAYCTIRKITPSGVVSAFLTPSSTTQYFYLDKDGPINNARANGAYQVSASQDGSLIFFTTIGSLRVIRPGKDVTTLARFKEGINGIAATPDGKTVYVSSGYAIHKVVLK